MKAQRRHNFLGLVMILVLVFSTPAIAQKSFGLELSYLTGFQDSQIEILNEPIDFFMPHGSQFTFLYSRRIKESPWLITTGLGGKYMSTHGQTSSQLHFSTNSFKVNALLGTYYQIYKDLDLGVQFIIESNRDMDDITYLKSNLFRYYLCVESAYSLSNNWGIAIKYWRSISSNDDVYLLFTPVNQISIGINFYFHEI